MNTSPAKASPANTFPVNTLRIPCLGESDSHQRMSKHNCNTIAPNPKATTTSSPSPNRVVDRSIDRAFGSAVDRRAVLRAGAGLGALAVSSAIAPGFTRSDEKGKTLRIGLVGCGGRGTGALINALNADPNTTLWSLGDVFADRIESCQRYAASALDAPDAESDGRPNTTANATGPRTDVPDERRFVGFDAFEKVLASGIDVVLLCTPPGFRPLHLRAAVDAKKHVFCEKPVAVDGPGVRSVIESARAARELNISVMSGFCWRYQSQMREVFHEIHDGGIGRVRAVQCTYNTSGFPEPTPRKAGWSDAEFQLRNWHYFRELSGDHIVEQAVHAIDWINWAFKGEMPVRCLATGGRSTRPDVPETGNIWDNFGITFEFADGARAYHQCRHWPNTPADNTAYIIGTEGDCRVMPWRGRHLITRHDGTQWKSSAPKNSMYQQEHDELFAAIRAGTSVNDGELMANSTLLGIMGRQAAYTGQAVTWDQAMQSEDNLNPEPWTWGDRPTLGIPIPGKTRLL